MQLRQYQSEAITATWSQLKTPGGGNPLIVLPTGAGKSIVIASLAMDAVKQYAGRVVVLQHRKELIEQNADKIKRLCDVPVGLYSAGLNRKQINEDVIVAGIQSIYKRAGDIGRRHMVIIDECFTGDTLISTPSGKRRIDNMRCGDIVYCANGVGEVMAVSCRPCQNIYEVKLSDGTTTRCTEKHKWFTDKGWRKTAALDIGAVAYGVKDVCSMWEVVQSLEVRGQERKGASVQGGSMEKAAMLLSVLCKEIQEPNEQSPGTTESKGKAKRANAQTYQAWRQRAIASFGSISTATCIRGGVGVGSCCTNWICESDRQGDVSDMLQNRYSKQTKDDRNRVGRKLACNNRKKGTGCEKNSSIDIVRVVSVSRIERKSVVPVFNLHVSGHPSYFANGRLVHNCHLLPETEEGMYRTFLEQLSELNPNLKIVGLTATPYRTDSGKLWGKESLFPQVTYDAGIQTLIAGGFLCQVTSNPGQVDYDTSGLHIKAGEFKSNELAQLFDSDSAKTQRAVSEIVARSSGRHSVLIFCSSVEHSYHVAMEIERQTGQDCGCIVGETMALERASILERFKNRQLRWLTNCAVLTTGFDAPCIDMIAILRATASPGLFAQICGRGLRTDELKANCLILDFGQNIKRFGPIDAIEFNEKNTKRTGDDAPMKMCPGCREEVPAGTRTCDCGFVFPKPELKHDETPDGESKILSEPEEFEVVQQTCNVHRKKSDPDGTPTLRVNYYVRPINEEDQNNLTEETISEWICIEHPPGFARSKAMEWWRARSLAPFPTRCEEAESLFDRWSVAQSRSIVARREGKWWRIIKHVLDEIPDPGGIEVVADSSGDWDGEEMPF